MRAWLERIRKRRAIARLRENLAAFGVLTEHLSDEEIEERLSWMAKASSHLGVTTAEASNAFAMMGAALRRRASHGEEK